jgi:hypothetical protein
MEGLSYLKDKNVKSMFQPQRCHRREIVQKQKKGCSEEVIDTPHPCGHHAEGLLSRHQYTGSRLLNTLSPLGAAEVPQHLELAGCQEIVLLKPTYSQIRFSAHCPQKH